MKKLTKLFSIIFLGAKMYSQNIEPSTFIEKYIVASIRMDTSYSENCVIKDSLIRNFSINYPLKSKELSSYKEAVLFYRLAFLGSLDAFLLYEDLVKDRNTLINESRFKVKSYVQHYIVADYSFSFLGNRMRKFRFRMCYLNTIGWKITSIVQVN